MTALSSAERRVEMNVGQLHRHLSRLVKEGHGRKPVCIDKSTFQHPCEDDGCVILEVHKVEGPEFIRNIDDDGGHKENNDGTESGRLTVVLCGTERDPS